MYPTQNLQPGMTGDAVRQLQQYLVSQGFLTQEKMNTGPGIYGPATTAAVKALQQKLGVDNSTGPGYWGPRTIQAISQPTRELPPPVVQPTQQPSPQPTPQPTQPTPQPPPLSVSPPQPSPEATRTKQLEAVVATIPGLKESYDILNLKLQQQLESGKKVNPDLTITPELAQKFVDDATKELDPYYQELINQHKQDLTISFRQLQEDYTKDIERAQQPFQQTLENQDITEANQGTAFSSGRVQREQQTVNEQQQKLDDTFTQAQRGVEKTGLTSERAIGSRNFADLGIPSLQSYSAQRNMIAPQGSLTATGAPRTLYTPQGGLFGELPASQKVATEKRAGELTTNELNKRVLDAGGLARTV